MEFFKNTGIIKYAIELVNRKQPFYRPIYAISLMELETLKAKIKNHLKTSFIQTSKLPAGAPIFFDN